MVIMRRYLKILAYTWPHRRLFGAIFVLTLVVSAVVILQPLPVTWVIDSVLGSAPLPSGVRGFACALFSGTPTSVQVLALCVALAALFYVLNTLLDAALAMAWTVAGRRAVNSLMEDLFARLQRRSLLYHSRTSVGESVSRVMVDSWCAHTMLEKLFFSPLLALLTMVGMVFLMSSFHHVLTWIALGMAPLMVVSSCLLGEKLRGASRRRRDVETRIQTHVQQVLSAIPVVQAFGQEARESARFEVEAQEAIRAQRQSILFESMGGLSSGLVTTLGTGVILWVGARYVIAGELTIGGLWLFLRYLTLLQTHVKTVAAVYPAAQGFRGTVERICQTLDAEPEVSEKSKTVILNKVSGSVRFENVTCGYEPGHPVLRGVTMEVPSGSVTAIMGATGAGKSTLASLIPRFLDPWQGRILLDGVDVRDLQLVSLRSHVAMVLQEPFLFSWSVADNIAYGRPGASQKEIEEAARAANAHEFIMRLPQGYDTILGERGATLSGGERQRLSISRAILKNAPILILDEPTSALDVQTERLIMEAFARLMKGRTTFIIAHRPSTIRDAGQIVVLKDGQICERGTHEELTARNGEYVRLCVQQQELSATEGRRKAHE